MVTGSTSAVERHREESSSLPAQNPVSLETTPAFKKLEMLALPGPEHEPEPRLPLEANARTPPRNFRGDTRERPSAHWLPLYPVPPQGGRPRLPANKGFMSDFSFEGNAIKGEMTPCGDVTVGVTFGRAL